jgi:hypothetical protein
VPAYSEPLHLNECRASEFEVLAASRTAVLSLVLKGIVFSGASAE